MRAGAQEANRATMLTLEQAMCDQFRRLREERGWSQTELSTRLASFGIDMHQTTIAKVEAGKRPLRVSEMFGFSHAFGLPPGAVFSLAAHDGPATPLNELQAELARADEVVDSMRAHVMSAIASFVDVAAEFGLERARLVQIMRGE